MLPIFILKDLIRSILVSKMNQYRIVKMKFGLLLIMLSFASEYQENKVESANSEKTFKDKNNENLILVKIEEDDCTKARIKTSKFFGVSYNKSCETWTARRWSKNENKNVYNGSYKDEEKAAHASDTLARKLMENGEQNQKLNFPEDHTEVLPEKTKTSKYFGVYYNETHKYWLAQRRSKIENKPVHNGTYKDEETAAHASDTLARTLMANGQQNLKLNFPDDHTEVFRERKSSQYFGVSHDASNERWRAHRHNKSENKMVHNGSYKGEEAAAHASDTLARKIMANGEQNLKLNFPDDDTKVFPEKNQRNKRKRSVKEDMDSQHK